MSEVIDEHDQCSSYRKQAHHFHCWLSRKREYSHSLLNLRLEMKPSPCQ
ncbi:hypothetical protein [Gibbsiella quercinecans]|nr:hypothetical protein [Gibbsiella quercinecans]